MTSTFVNDLRLNEQQTGDNSGSWGTVTNTNLELIAEAFSFGTEAITTNADTHATTIADGGTDPGRSMFLKYTGTLDSACTITIGPNTVSKLWFIENGTSGSQNIIIKQGSGATITIPAGQTKAIYSNGAGSGGAMVDAFATLNVVDLLVDDDLTVTDDVAIGGTALVTGVLTTTAATVFNGGFASNGNSTVDGTFIPSGKITADAGIDIDNFNIDGTSISLSSGVMTINAADVRIKNVANNETMAQFDDDGAVSLFHNNVLCLSTAASGSVTIADNLSLTSDAARINIGAGNDLKLIHDGTNGTFESAGNLTVDVAGNIFLNADGSLIIFSDAAVEYGRVGNSSSDFAIQALVQDKDIQFKGNDNGSIITALTLDMSDVGSATFNGSTRAPFGLFGEIYEVTNGADISLTKVSEDSGIAVSCRSTTNGHTPYLTFQKTPATSGNYTATASGDFLGLINFKGVNTSGGSNEGARIQVVQNGALSGSVPATMIIEASGQAQLHMAANSTSGAAVCIGGTAISRRLDVRSTNITTAGFFYQDASDVALMQLGHAGATGSNTRTMIQFQNAAGTEKGTIKTTTSATSFNTSSDYRLKENVNYSWDATTRLKQLKPARFNWIEDDTNTLLDGFMAHEVTSVVPEATDGAKDGVKTVTNAVLNSFGNVLAEDVTEADWTAGKIARTDADGNEVAEATYPSNTSWTASQEMPVYQQIDQSKLVPLLVKTILELESRITALEG